MEGDPVKEARGKESTKEESNDYIIPERDKRRSYIKHNFRSCH